MKEHQPKSFHWKKIKSAFKENVIEIARLFSPDTGLEEALGRKILVSVLKQIQYYRRLHGQIKWTLNFGAKMKNSGKSGEIVETFFFSSSNRTTTLGEITLSQDIEKEFRILTERVLDLDVDTEGSGWSFVSAEVTFQNLFKR